MVQGEYEKIVEKVINQALTDQNVMNQLTQTLNEHIEECISGGNNSQDNREDNGGHLSTYTSDDCSAYGDELDNNTILEAPSVMEQTVYDDRTSSFTKKLTKKFSKKFTEQLDSCQILR